jgi:TIR domain/RyR domain
VISVPASRGWLRSGRLVVTDERVAFVSRGSTSLDLPLTAIERVEVDDSRLRIAAADRKPATFRLREGGSPTAVKQAIEEQAGGLRRMRDDLAKAFESSIDVENIPPAADFEPGDQALRDRVLRVAEGRAVALRRLGYTVEPAGGEPDVVRLDEGAVEALARGEHERWAWETEAGRLPLASILGSRHKLHPRLMPWERLDESDRERERETARELPTVLAQAGLTLKEVGSTGAFAPLPPPGGPTPPAPPHAPGDTVEASVFAPAEAATGDTVFVQVFAHLIKQAGEAEAMALEFDPESGRRAVRTLGFRVPQGARLHFELIVPGAEVDDPVQSLVWAERPESVQFAVIAPDSPGTLVGTVHVTIDGAPVGHLKFKLSVVADRPGGLRRPLEPAGEAARRYTKAFVSYASPDRASVLIRVQMLRAVGIEYFQDVLDLEPGERWVQALYRHIDDCDLFLLCWSQYAKESEWVRREAARARERQGEDGTGPPEIRPVILEGPPVPEPWPELAHLHFNDRLTYLLAVEA